MSGTPLMLVFDFPAVGPEVVTKRPQQCQSLPSLWKSWCWTGFLAMLLRVPRAQPLLVPVGTGGNGCLVLWKSGPLCKQDCPDPTVGERMGPPWIWAFVHSLWAVLHTAGEAESWTEPVEILLPIQWHLQNAVFKRDLQNSCLCTFRNTLDYFHMLDISYVFFLCWKARREAGKGESSRAAVLF